MSLTRVDLPEPETPVTAVNVPSGNVTSIVCRLCSRAPTIVRSRPLVRGRRAAGVSVGVRRLREAAGGGWGRGEGVDRRAPAEVGAGERVGAGQQVLDSAGDDDLATVLARARPDVDHPV